MKSHYLAVLALLHSVTLYALPPAEKKVTVTLFQWNFASVANECREVLGPSGYGYVQISPPQEHIQGSAWWTSYQPVSYQLTSRLGSEADFASMIEICHQAGVQVIADVVINHMTTGEGNGKGTGGSSYEKYNYPGLYQIQDFHQCHEEISDYSNRDNVQNCELDHLADLDTGSDYVQNRIVDYLDTLISLGIDGFRIDAAKHISTIDLNPIKAKVSKDVFWIQEVIPGVGEAVTPWEYLSIGDVDEFRYAWDLKRVFEKEQLAYLSNFGEGWGYLPTKQARVFTDNWDTERNGSTLNYHSGANYTLANVFMLAYPYGEPNIYSSYEFTNQNDGAPDNGQVNECYNGKWNCQHRWPQIANMVAFHNAVKNEPLTAWWSNGNNLIAFGRGNKGFVAINHENYPVNFTFKTPLPEGIYCDIQHGHLNANQECIGQSYSIKKDGKFTARIKPNEAIALYVH